MDCVERRPATMDLMAVAAMVPFCTYSDVQGLDAGERRSEGANPIPRSITGVRWRGLSTRWFRRGFVSCGVDHEGVKALCPDRLMVNKLHDMLWVYEIVQIRMTRDTGCLPRDKTMVSSVRSCLQSATDLQCNRSISQGIDGTRGSKTVVGRFNRVQAHELVRLRRASYMTDSPSVGRHA
jgi:hypothetical protein